MAIITLPYTDINGTMKAIRTQVLDSLYFCKNSMPTFNNPEQMFNALREMIVYKNDPPGVELLQSVPTLFKNNYHGIPGAGDCDCFSILVLSMCAVHGWNDQKIVLAGRTKLAPVHIWTQVYYNGAWYDLDLTNKYFNTTRKYKYLQFLPI
jgi:transglutaminase-like putative cysteine protease